MFFERNPDLKGAPGIAFTHHFVVGLKDENERVRADIRWSQTYYRLGWDEDKVREALARGEHVPSGTED